MAGSIDRGTAAGAASRRRLLAWYRRSRRDLPWRRTNDPYAIWVSEMMLQQTRVAAAIPFYGRFLARFPDVHALARARIDDVLALWAGLGYYRRARHLHAASRIVAKTGFPRTEAEWRELPGIGPYAAAAIASIAFGERAAAVDGNVVRVLSRLHATTGPVHALARAWLSPRYPGDHNQALMELGATLCTPRAPSCPRCPLSSSCAGRNDPATYPAPRARPKITEERLSVAVILRAGKVQLFRRRPDGLLAGMWELPPAAPRGEPLAVVRHSLLDRRQVISVFRGRPRRGGRFFGDLSRVPVTSASRKCIRAIRGVTFSG
ncbi:MAG TPA: A/G-specific adenine glycosylase [Planctomycetota bacterium]|nr:A/G-specific adenine glycosylase [Planctomycetota bacterium]